MSLCKLYVDLEGTMLGGIKSEKDKYCIISLRCGIWKTKNEQTKQTDPGIQKNWQLPEGRVVGVWAKRLKGLSGQTHK